MDKKLIVDGNSRFIQTERWYGRKKRMKIRINDLARNRVDGIERMDQIRRERATAVAVVTVLVLEAEVLEVGEPVTIRVQERET